MPKLWSKSIGERGNRVRIYEARPGGNLMRSVYIDGKEDRRSLGHRDRERAIREAHEFVAHLLAHERAFEDGTLTLDMVVGLYLKSPAYRDKKECTQREDARRLERVMAFLGSDRRVDTLGESDVRRYVRARKTGRCALPGIPVGRKVGNRAVQSDLVALQTALNWATRERDVRGRRLLAENPLSGVPLPREKNPKRPVMRHDEYLALLEVAGQLPGLFRPVLITAEQTGRRIGAITKLRWDDVDLQHKTIRWRAEADKKGYEQVTPISDELQTVLKDWRSESPGIGSAWVFPAPNDSDRPCRRDVLSSWLRKAYALAGLEKRRGGCWHPLRRKWATERKGRPVADVAYAGGWRDVETMLRSYQQADPETVRQVMLEPTHRLTGSDEG